MSEMLGWNTKVHSDDDGERQRKNDVTTQPHYICFLSVTNPRPMPFGEPRGSLPHVVLLSLYWSRYAIYFLFNLQAQMKIST